MRSELLDFCLFYLIIRIIDNKKVLSVTPKEREQTCEMLKKQSKYSFLSRFLDFFKI